MKKLFILLLLTVAFLSNAAEVTSVTKLIDTNVYAVKNTDFRVQALENVLDKYNSPLKPYASYFVQSADKNDIDWRLLPSIAGLESTFGKRQLSGSYNSYGWGGGHIYFKSVEDGIDTVMSALNEKYATRGATTVETIAPIYSESPTWAPRIRNFMNTFEAEYAKLGLHSLELTI